MPAAYTTLEITDGTTTLDLVDGTNYALRDQSWSPVVANEKLSRAGGSMFEDVDENPIVIDILGSTGEVVLNNLHNLRALLNQAERWRRGEAVDPVVLNVLAQGSTLTADQQAVILGQQTGSRPLITLPPNFMDYLHTNIIEGAEINFRRRGEWLAATETETSSGSTNPAVLTASTFTRTADIACPMDIVISGFIADFRQKMVLPMTNAANKLALVMAPTHSITVPGSGTFNTGTDSGYLVAGTNVRKLVPNSLGEYTAGTNITMNSDIRTIAGYIVCRNLSNDVSYLVRVKYYGTGSTEVETRKRVIPAGVTTDPIILALGPATIGASITAFDLIFEPSSTGTSTDALHLNYTAFVGIDDSSHVIYLDQFGENGGATAAVKVQLLHGRLDKLRAEVNELNASDVVINRPLPRGNATVFMTGNTFACLPFGVTEDSPNGYYVLANQTPAAVSLAIEDVTRADAWLTPR